MRQPAEKVYINPVNITYGPNNQPIEKVEGGTLVELTHYWMRRLESGEITIVPIKPKKAKEGLKDE